MCGFDQLMIEDPTKIISPLLSRHRQIDTLMIYDDNRAKDQVEISEKLSGLVE